MQKGQALSKRQDSRENIFRIQTNANQNDINDLRTGSGGSGRVKQFTHKPVSTRTKFENGTEGNPLG
jgi:hypothetical protein